MLEPIRCKKCHRLLLKGKIEKIEIMCPKCGYINSLELDKKAKRLYSISEKRAERYDRQP